MTHAPTSPPPDSPPATRPGLRTPALRPARYSLDDELWAEIARRYADGATGPELAAHYRISIGTVHRHMKRLGMTKRGAGSRFARAHAAEVIAREATEIARRRPEADLLRLAVEQSYDPMLLAQIAITASGNALLALNVSLARQLLELAMLYDRVSLHEPVTVTQRLVDLAFNRKLTDNMYDYWPGEDQDTEEYEVKRAYWRLRIAEKRAEQARAEEEARLRARVAELEGEGGAGARGSQVLPWRVD